MDKDMVDYLAGGEGVMDVDGLIERLDLAARRKGFGLEGEAAAALRELQGERGALKAEVERLRGICGDFMSACLGTGMAGQLNTRLLHKAMDDRG